MSADPTLVHAEGPFLRKAALPFTAGAWLFSNLRGIEPRARIFADVFAPHQSLLRDDLGDEVAPDVFQQRLWGMFTVHYPHTLTLPQRDRVRWHLPGDPGARAARARPTARRRGACPVLPRPVAGDGSAAGADRTHAR